jgi:hypothetical protein
MKYNTSSLKLEVSPVAPWANWKAQKLKQIQTLKKSNI